MLLLIVSIALALIPLFNVLGYEFSLVIAGAIVLLAAPTSFGLLASSSSKTGAPHAGPIGVFARVLKHNAMLLAIPLVISTLNAARVQNCDYTGGLALFALIPGVTVAWVSLVAMVCDTLTRGRKVLRYVAYFAVLLASVAGTLAYLALEPPIVAVNPYLAFFAGSIYDEALSLPTPLIAYRLIQLGLIAGLLMAWESAWRRQSGDPSWRYVGVAAAVVLLGAGWAHSAHERWGYSLDREDIQAALGGRYETEHFVIYYAAEGDWAERIVEIGEDHEFRYAQLKAFFGLEPELPVVSFVYPDKERKGRLMGARNTLVAKLWLGEMHITYNGYGNDVLKHELAHIFTAPFGSGPLDLSTSYGIFPNMGLVEGVASAAEWRITAELTPHGWSAALHRLRLAPDLTRVIGAGGFWSQHSRTVYTLVGSFVRWLVDTRGVERFKEAYGTGDFEGTYGETLPALVAEWQSFLTGIALSEDELAQASYLFDRPSIFEKVCARSLAEERRAIQGLSAAGRFDEGARRMRAVVEQDPDNLNGTLQLIQLLVQAKDFKTAQREAEALLEREGIGAVMRSRTQMLLGDILWREQRLDGARQAYSALLARDGLPVHEQRAVEIKLAGLDDEALRPVLAAYFFAEQDIGRIVARLYAARESLGEHAVVSYLLGLRLFSLREHERAGALLEEAVTLGLPSETVTENARFLWGQAEYFSGDFAEAAKQFEMLSKSARHEGGRARGADWLERVLWRDNGSEAE